MYYLGFIIIALAVAAYLLAPLVRRNKAQGGLLAALMLTGTAGLWFALSGGAGLDKKLAGRPPTAPAATDSPIDNQAGPQSAEELVMKLRSRLTELDIKDPEGWALLARSEMRLGNYDLALEAYDKAVSYSDQSQALMDERAAAKKFAAQAGAGPSRADIEAAAQMSPDNRQQMILTMVDNLAQKLDENPDDANGWIKLLRARGVLGQTEQMQADIQAMKAAFADRPGEAAQILSAAGLSD